MQVNGHQLPKVFVGALADKSLSRVRGCWPLKEEVDSYGNHFESELGQIFETEVDLTRETRQLAENFVADGVYGGPSDWSTAPGFLEDITDFSLIVAFAMSADGAPFCFDYRDSKTDPAIIWWDDTYWRRVADSFEGFLALFDFGKT